MSIFGPFWQIFQKYFCQKYFFEKNSILRHSEAFFGHSEENKKVLELNFTPENTSGWVFLVHFDRFSKNIFAKNIFFLKKISGINQGWSDESPLKIWAWLDVRNPGAFITIECVTVRFGAFHQYFHQHSKITNGDLTISDSMVVLDIGISTNPDMLNRPTNEDSGALHVFCRSK